MKAFFTGLTAGDLAALLRTPAGRALMGIAIRGFWAKRNQPTTVTYLGNSFHVPDLLSWLWQALDIWVHQNYRFLTPQHPPRILDLGANVGTASVWFACAYPQAQVTAVEPDPLIANTLKTNLAQNGAGNVNAIHAAAWIHASGVTFAPAGADTGGIASTGTAVPSLRVHDLILDGPVVDLLKLDVEGAEMAILPDIAPALHHVNNLFVEWHSYAGQTQHLAELLAILQTAGFRYYVAARHDAKRHRQPLSYLPQWSGMDGNLDIYAVRTGR